MCGGGAGFEPAKLSRQIYSLIPLATREPHPGWSDILLLAFVLSRTSGNFCAPQQRSLSPAPTAVRFFWRRPAPFPLPFPAQSGPRQAATLPKSSLWFSHGFCRGSPPVVGRFLVARQLQGARQAIGCEHGFPQGLTDKITPAVVELDPVLVPGACNRLHGGGVPLLSVLQGRLLGLGSAGKTRQHYAIFYGALRSQAGRAPPWLAVCGEFSLRPCVRREGECRPGKLPGVRFSDRCTALSTVAARKRCCTCSADVRSVKGPACRHKAALAAASEPEDMRAMTGADLCGLWVFFSSPDHGCWLCRK